MFIFTAPSGAGKTTIVRHILEKFPFLDFSVSATTRPKRAHETDGVDYHFISVEAFQEHIHQEEFAEWEEVYQGQYYGTLHSEIARIWAQGKHLVFDIDVKGAMNLKKNTATSAWLSLSNPRQQKNSSVVSKPGIRKHLKASKKELPK